MADRINWRAAPTVVIPVTLASCPECGTAKPVHVRGDDNSDPELSLEYVTCRRCRLPFKVQREYQPPNWRNDDTALE